MHSKLDGWFVIKNIDTRKVQVCLICQWLVGCHWLSGQNGARAEFEAAVWASAGPERPFQGGSEETRDDQSYDNRMVSSRNQVETLSEIDWVLSFFPLI